MSTVSDLIQEMVRDMLNRANGQSDYERQTDVSDSARDKFLPLPHSVSLSELKRSQ
jgi:hypothetical protein